MLQYAEVSGIVVALAAVATFAVACRCKRSVFEHPESEESWENLGRPSSSGAKKTHGQGNCPYASGIIAIEPF